MGAYVFCCLCFLIMSGSHVSESRKQECKSASTDVVFLLDSSGSVGSENFKKILNFTKAIVSRFTVGPHNTLVGIETFASTVHHQFALDANKNMATLLTAVDNVPYQTGGTNIEAALKYVNDYSFKAGGRRNAVKILILITDGQTYSPNGTAIQAKSLRKTNIKVFCIGIGHSINSKELQHISSGADHTFLIEDFNSLTTAIKVMHSVICKDIYQALTTIPVHSTMRTSTRSISKSTKRTTATRHASKKLPTAPTTHVKPSHTTSKTISTKHAFPTTRTTSKTTNTRILTRRTTITQHTSTKVPTTLTTKSKPSLTSKMYFPSTIKKTLSPAYTSTFRMTKFVSSAPVKAHSRMTTAKQSTTEERKRNVTAKATTKLKTTMQVSKNIKAPVYLRDVIHGFEYLEVTVLSIVSVIAMGAFGCCCRFCFIFAKRKETEEEEKPKRKPPCKRPKGWPSY